MRVEVFYLSFCIYGKSPAREKKNYNEGVLKALMQIKNVHVYSKYKVLAGIKNTSTQMVCLVCVFELYKVCSANN